MDAEHIFQKKVCERDPPLSREIINKDALKINHLPRQKMGNSDFFLIKMNNCSYIDSYLKS